MSGVERCCAWLCLSAYLVPRELPENSQYVTVNLLSCHTPCRAISARAQSRPPVIASRLTFSDVHFHQQKAGYPVHRQSLGDSSLVASHQGFSSALSLSTVLHFSSSSGKLQQLQINQ